MPLDDQLHRDFNELAKSLQRLEETVECLGTDLRTRIERLESRVAVLEARGGAV